MTKINQPSEQAEHTLPYQDATLDYRVESVLADDLHLVVYDGVLEQDYYHEVPGKSSISFQIRLSGKSSDIFGEFIETQYDAPGLYVCSYPEGMEKKASVKSGTHLTLVSICCQASALTRVLGFDLEELPEPFSTFAKGGDVDFFFQRLPLPPDLIQSAQTLIEPAFSGNTRRLFARAKTIELLCQIFQILEDSEQIVQPSVKFKPKDISALDVARSRLIEKATEPPTISELARFCGLNETKLKLGFKHLYGTTLGQFCQTLRMEMASKLLIESEKTVTEIAFDVGYSHTASFTKIFKTHYGYTPSELRRTTKADWGETSD